MDNFKLTFLGSIYTLVVFIEMLLKSRMQCECKKKTPLLHMLYICRPQQTLILLRFTLKNAHILSFFTKLLNISVVYRKECGISFNFVYCIKTYCIE